MHRFATLALLAACTAHAPAPAKPSPASAEPSPPPRPEATGLEGALQPWHVVDPAWRSARVWLVARLEGSTYPCVDDGHGGLKRLLQERFVIEEVLRGEVAAPGIDAALGMLRGPAYPRAFAEGRRYLLFIEPGRIAQAELADPNATGRMDRRLGPDELIAAVDLDARADEVAAEAVVAARTGERAGLRFDPRTWADLRAAASPEPATQRALAGFLQARVTLPESPLAEVRAWLGPPDVQILARDGAREDRYILSAPAFKSPRQDAIYGVLALHYDSALRLASASLLYSRWSVTPRVHSSSTLSPEEHAALGLPRFAAP